PARGEPLDRRALDVGSVDRAPGFREQIGAHGLAHDAEPDEPEAVDWFHEHHPFVCFPSPARSTSASTAITPCPCARTMSGLTSASTIAGSDASCYSPTIACASAARSPAGRPRKPDRAATPLSSAIISRAVARST